MKTLLLGMGNPLRGDDSVGWLVAKQVGLVLAQGAERGDGIDVVCCDEGGVGLMERLVGYDHAVLIDAMSGCASRPGEIRRFALDEAGSVSGCQTSAHGIGFPTALALGRAIGARLPRTITLIGIEAQVVDTFSAELSPAVAAALPAAVQAVLDELRRIWAEGRGN